MLGRTLVAPTGRTSTARRRSRARTARRAPQGRADGLQHKAVTPASAPASGRPSPAPRIRHAAGRRGKAGLRDQRLQALAGGLASFWREPCRPARRRPLRAHALPEGPAQRAALHLHLPAESHKAAYEWLDILEPGDFRTVSETRREADGPKRTWAVRFAKGVPLSGEEGAPRVNWIGLTVTDSKGRQTYRNCWATDLDVDAGNAVELAACGRARWAIENGNNNTLKTKGYHLDHNFGHGRSIWPTRSHPQHPRVPDAHRPRTHRTALP